MGKGGMIVLNINKKIHLNLGALDGNAFVLMGAFSRQAKRERWTKEEIKAVLDECMSRDYSHLLSTLTQVTIAEAVADEEEDDG